MLGEIRQGPKPVERMEFELFNRLAVSISLNHRFINVFAETKSIPEQQWEGYQYAGL